MRGNTLTKNDKAILNKNKCPNCSGKIVNLRCDGGGTENYGCKSCGYRYYLGVDWGVSGRDKSIIIKNRELRKGWTCEKEKGLDIYHNPKLPKKLILNMKEMTNKELANRLKVVSNKKFLDKLKNVKKIELAPTDCIDKYQKEINIILKLLGHPEALVTDESSVWDFLYHFGGTKQENDKYNKKMLDKISGRLGFEVKDCDLFVDVAKKIRK